MADASGFMKYERALPPRRPVDIRIMDWKDVYLSRAGGSGTEAEAVFPVAAVRKQAARAAWTAASPSATTPARWRT